MVYYNNIIPLMWDGPSAHLLMQNIPYKKPTRILWVRAKEAARDDNIMEIALSRRIAMKKVHSVAKALVVYILWTNFSSAGIIIIRIGVINFAYFSPGENYHVASYKYYGKLLKNLIILL